MKLFIFFNMEATRFGRWVMEGFPAKYHALFGAGFMTFTGPKERVFASHVKHELVHHYQAQREGWLRWTINYYREFHAVGYWDNKYEVEAYERMHEPLTRAERELVGMPRFGLGWIPL